MSLYIVDIHGELEGDYEIIKKYEEPFINKPCVSSGVCEHDKQIVLDKIRAEIESITPKAHIRTGKLSIDTELMIPLDRVLKVIDKYKADSEGT